MKCIQGLIFGIGTELPLSRRYMPDCAPSRCHPIQCDRVVKELGA